MTNERLTHVEPAQHRKLWKHGQTTKKIEETQQQQEEIE
jgi:hypothetical protein